MGSFSLYQWAIVAVIGFGIYSIFKSSSGSRVGSSGAGQMHCMTCGTDGWGASRTKGSIFIEIILWLCFIVPGLIYSIWRLTTRRKVCAACGSEAVVPFNAPAAVNHRQRLSSPEPQ